MKKAGILIIAILLISSFLCSCGYNTYSIEKIGDVLENSFDETTEEDKVNFTAEIPTEEFLAATDYYFLLDDESGEYTKVLFKTDYTISDVMLFNVIVPNTTAVSSAPLKGDIILKMDTLTPDKPVVIDIKTEGYTAVRGISFVDPNGATQYYTVAVDSLGGIIFNNVYMRDHPKLTAEYPGKNYLENPENYVTYEDSKEDYTKVLFKIHGAVTDFRFLSIEPTDPENANGRYTIAKVLHTIGEFGPSMPFVAETKLGEATPTRGISFVDEHGITRYFTVNYLTADNKELVLEEVVPMTEK